MKNVPDNARRKFNKSGIKSSYFQNIRNFPGHVPRRPEHGVRLAGPGLPVGHDVAVEPVEEALDPLWHVVVVEHLLKDKIKWSITFVTP